MPEFPTFLMCLSLFRNSWSSSLLPFLSLGFRDFTSLSPSWENKLKLIDEKGSDGGEGDLPRNQDEDHDQFNKGSDEVEEIELAAGVKF
ncbi:hypothetical protein KIW84_056160 [Lathyrus oleraceus]|uniref:Uncharacterized protein n=1 Tax=Pisum sativum TaxID=3888 RepID=A0A9D4WXG9_PEA|nr:hypothetical protein KIW84_056160 [Pisum sativum]